MQLKRLDFQNQSTLCVLFINIYCVILYMWGRVKAFVVHLPFWHISNLPFCTTQLTACSPETLPPKISSPPAACRSWCLGARGVKVFPAVAFLPALRPWPNAAEQVGEKLASSLFIIIIPSIISSLASFSEPVLSRWKTSVPTAQMQQPMNQIGAYTNCKEHNVVCWQCFAFIGKQFCHHYKNIQHTFKEPSSVQNHT